MNLFQYEVTETTTKIVYTFLISTVGWYHFTISNIQTMSTWNKYSAHVKVRKICEWTPVEEKNGRKIKLACNCGLRDKLHQSVKRLSYVLDDQGLKVQFRTGADDFHFLTTSIPTLGSTSSVGIRDSFFLERQESKCDYPLTSRAKVKNAWSYAPFPDTSWRPGALLSTGLTLLTLPIVVVKNAWSYAPFPDTSWRPGALLSTGLTLLTFTYSCGPKRLTKYLWTATCRMISLFFRKCG
jgi:hypothetical protein